MSTKNKNPYRDGSAYHSIFGYMKKKQVFTRQELIDQGFKSADVTVVLSPRLESKRGDCRGNMSAAGHVYYLEKLGRKVKAGVKEPQKFRLRYRAEEMEPRKRVASQAVASEKVAKETAKVETKAEAKAKA